MNITINRQPRGAPIAPENPRTELGRLLRMVDLLDNEHLQMFCRCVAYVSLRTGFQVGGVLGALTAALLTNIVWVLVR